MTTTIHQLGDRISALTLIEARQLSEYLKDVHGIEPATSPAVVPRTVDKEQKRIVPQKSSFDVVLTGFNGNRVAIIRTVRAITGLGLQESMKAVDSLPFKVQVSQTQKDANALKSQLEEAGGVAELT